MSETILITGAAKRIGKEIALSLADSGYDIIIHYNHSHDDAFKVCQQIQNKGRKSCTIKADLTSEVEAKAIFDKIPTDFSPLKAIINNASIFKKDSIDKIDNQIWNDHFNIHIKAPLILSQGLSTTHNKSKPSHIINIIDSGINRLSPNYLSYGLSKAGLLHLTKQLAVSLAPEIHVNAISPGHTLINETEDPKQFYEKTLESPLKKNSETNDIIQAVIFLLKNTSITGENICVDSGAHLQNMNR